MTTTEKLSQNESAEKTWSLMEDLRRQAEAKKQALEQPKRKDVSGKSCTFWDKEWSYYGSWLEWGKNNLNCPWAGNWIFQSADGSLKIEWKFDNDWLPIKPWKITVDGVDFAIEKTYYNGAPTKLDSLVCKGAVDWKNYDCVLDNKFQFKEITYSWITLNLVHENGKSYLKNKGGRRLELSTTMREDLAAVRIAKAISIVRNAIENGEKSGLDYFETDDIDLQADYLGTWRDTTIYQNCRFQTWVTSDRLVSWLNASRGDRGL